MKIILSDYHRELLDDVKSFAETEIKPYAAEADKQQFLPRELLSKMSEKKYLGATFPRELGGLELDPIIYGLLTEEIGKYCCNVRNVLTVHVSIAGQCLLEWGTKEQIEKWIPLMAEGKKIGAFSITEPEVGSDAKNINTAFKKDGAHYIINGRKKWCTLGEIADLFLVASRCEDKMAVFIVEKATDGVEVKPLKGLLGSRASHLAEIEFNNVIIPEENILGDIESGLNNVVATALDHARYSVAWGSVAVAQASLEAMISYSRKRSQFGEKIRSFQLIQEFIANAVTNIYAARSLCLRAGELRKKGDDNAVIETTLAKYFASKIAMKVATDAVQAHGGNGCRDEFPVERLFREAKILEIIEGTSQILLQVISNMALIHKI